VLRQHQQWRHTSSNSWRNGVNRNEIHVSGSTVATNVALQLVSFSTLTLLVGRQSVVSDALVDGLFTEVTSSGEWKSSGTVRRNNSSCRNVNRNTICFILMNLYIVVFSLPLCMFMSKSVCWCLCVDVFCLVWLYRSWRQRGFAHGRLGCLRPSEEWSGRQRWMVVGDAAWRLSWLRPGQLLASRAVKILMPSVICYLLSCRWVLCWMYLNVDWN